MGACADDLRVMLPQFALPGGRMPLRDLPFVHRLYRPDDLDGSVIAHLHGSGGSEADLMRFAHRIAPRATLLGVRGRSTEEGVNRWFRRFDAGTFDQEDIRGETEAFEAFVTDAVRGYGLEAGRMIFLGHSNGANFPGAVMLLYPGVVRRAILLRAGAVLEDVPSADLSRTEVLLLSGATDPFAATAPALGTVLRERGTRLDSRSIPVGHDLTQGDLDAAADWL
jgi:phospholipase/carboxylesterase